MGLHNILFYTLNKPIPTIGGVEQATNTTAALLQGRGHRVFSMYINNIEGTISDCFTNSLQLRDDYVSKIRDFITNNDIDTIINQTDFHMASYFRQAIVNLHCSLITAHHFAPRWDFQFMSFVNVLNSFRQNKNIKNLVKIIFYPIFKFRYYIICKRYLFRGFNVSDKVVLLSDHYKEGFLKTINKTDGNKITTIPNTLASGIPTYDLRQIAKKEKIALIVSRLDEGQKRLSKALKIWKDVTEDENLKDWNMIIVGEGKSRKMYENYIASNNLQSRIKIVGKSIPWDYYKKASLFLMTSKSEGFGLTLIEAQHFGVVPMCFNSFEAAKDVIRHNETGMIIPNNNMTEYRKVLIQLMKDDALRLKMAHNGIKYVSERYSAESICNLWETLIDEVSH